MAKFIERLRENKFIKEYLKNYELRTYISSGFSALFSLLFAGYNLYIGITFRAIWNLSIAGYFVITLIIKTTIDIFEIKWQKNKLEKQEKTKKRYNLFIVSSIMMLVMDFALFAPTILMALFQKEVKFTVIMAIALATYTCYKIVMASINYAKTRKNQNPTVKILRTILFAEALVSILTLQNTLIMTFGEVTTGMKTLVIVSSTLILFTIISLSIMSLTDAINKRKSLKQPKADETFTKL